LRAAAGDGGVGGGVCRGGGAAAAELLRTAHSVFPPRAKARGQAAANKNAKIVRIGVVNGHAPRPVCTERLRHAHCGKSYVLS